MDGVTNVIREFSSTYLDLYNGWKYTVKETEEGLEIKYWEIGGNGIMVEKEKMLIGKSCAELFFKTVAQDFEDGIFQCN